MILVDKKKQILVVRRGSVLTRNLKFDGTVVSGMNCSFLGNIEAREVKLIRNCVVGGTIKCTRAIVGANSEFNVIEAEDVIVMSGCRGKRILASGDVRVGSNCSIGEILADRILVEGNSKIEKMEARKILALHKL